MTRHGSQKEAYVSVSENTYTPWSMTVLSLKTELDVAEFLLKKGWFPEEINGILVFPLPGAAFYQLGSKTHPIVNSDVIKATTLTPTTLFRARQLLASAGWLDRELDSLLKPCLYSVDPWANQTIHHTESHCQDNYGVGKQRLSYLEVPLLSTLNHYRRAMAFRRIVSLLLVIIGVSLAVVLLS